MLLAWWWRALRIALNRLLRSTSHALYTCAVWIKLTLRAARRLGLVSWGKQLVRPPGCAMAVRSDQPALEAAVWPRVPDATRCDRA